MKENKNDGSWAYGIIGFFLPIVGITLFFAWINYKKRASKAALIGAIIGFVLQIFSSIGTIGPIISEIASKYM